ncbi:MAG: DNA translocase FtsK 4TM domain-containing protein, partial [Methylococcaceae bacterium]|nr:DNA translocase FtsK 4TM domain-containing protein [Methylococcaceae bacterium]
MSQTDKKVPATTDIAESLRKGAREMIFLTFAAVALFLFISLFTFNLEDAGWTHSGAGKPIINGGGAVGAWLSDFSFSLIGVLSYLLPLQLAVYGYSIYKHETARAKPTSLTQIMRGLGLLAVITAGTALCEIHLPRIALDLPQSSGGILGQEIAARFLSSFGHTGASVLLATVFLLGVSLYSGISWLSMIDAMGKYSLLVVNGFFSVFAATRADAALPTSPAVQREKTKPPREPVGKPALAVVEKPEPAKPPAMKKLKPADLPPARPGELPPLDLLNQKAAKIKGYSKEALDN